MLTSASTAHTVCPVALEALELYPLEGSAKPGNDRAFAFLRSPFSASQRASSYNPTKLSHLPIARHGGSLLSRAVLVPVHLVKNRSLHVAGSMLIENELLAILSRTQKIESEYRAQCREVFNRASVTGQIRNTAMPMPRWRPSAER